MISRRSMRFVLAGRRAFVDSAHTLDVGRHAFMAASVAMSAHAITSSSGYNATDLFRFTPATVKATRYARPSISLLFTPSPSIN